MHTVTKNELHYLGPAGTFSEIAAKALAQRMGRPVLVPQPNFTAIVDAVRSTGSAGVLPYYNLLEGLVQEGIDLIYERGLRVSAAVRLPIRFVAGSRDGNLKQDSVASHPKALAQCSDFLRDHLPAVPQVAVSSTAEAAKIARDQSVLAISTEEAILANGLKVIKRDVGNRPAGRINFTDFLYVSADTGHREAVTGTQSSRTLISITPHREHAGLLAAILAQFAYHGLNIAKIHSRPTLELVDTSIEPQMFYLEVMGHPGAEDLKQCVQSLSWRFNDKDKPASAVRVLGSWTELQPPVPEVPSAPFDALDPSLVIGVNGGLGQLFAKQLLSLGVRVKGIDLQPEAKLPELKDYKQADPKALPPASLEGMKWIILCIPEDAAINAIPSLEKIGPQAFVTDVLSVKSPLAAALKGSNFNGSWLSLHPMFAPSLQFKGQNVCVIQLAGEADTEQAKAVTSMLEAAGATLTSLVAADHDRLTSVLQAATHASLLALGQTLSRSGVDPNVAMRLATPINQALFAMLARMTKASDSLYQSMQVDNPFAREARTLMVDALQSLDEKMLQAAPGAMQSLFEVCRKALGEHVDHLAQTSALIARTIAESRARDKKN